MFCTLLLLLVLGWSGGEQERWTGYEAVWWSQQGLEENEMINHWGVHVAMMPLISIASSAGLKGVLGSVCARVREGQARFSASCRWGAWGKKRESRSVI
jgi:hypothetical protein